MKNKLFLVTLLSMVFLFAFASIDDCKIKSCTNAESPEKIIEAADGYTALPCENILPFNLLIKI
jgi:uncharacterized membrane protein